MDECRDVFLSFQDEGFKINFKHFPNSQFKIQKSEHLELLLTPTLELVCILQGWNIKPSRCTSVKREWNFAPPCFLGVMMEVQRLSKGFKFSKN